LPLSLYLPPAPQKKKKKKGKTQPNKISQAGPIPTCSNLIPLTKPLHIPFGHFPTRHSLLSNHENKSEETKIALCPNSKSPQMSYMYIEQNPLLVLGFSLVQFLFG
jgi:hypothetical protein